MRRSVLQTALFFGVLIGLLLLAMQYGRFLLWPWRPVDGFPALVGAIFLAAGVLLGLRLHRPGTQGEENPESRAREQAFRPPPDSPLSPRESEILLSLAEGCANAEIARRHSVSINTVKTHVRQICAKLGARRRGEAVARARDMGLLP